MLANRRTILRSATGLAAAAVVGSALIDKHEAAAEAPAAQADVEPSPVIQAIRVELAGLPAFYIDAFAWGVTEDSNSSDPRGKHVSKPTFQDFHFTKKIDVATPELLKRTVQGTGFNGATITILDAEGKEFMTYELETVIVSSYSVGGTVGGAIPMETGTLQFEDLKMKLNSPS